MSRRDGCERYSSRIIKSWPLIRCEKGRGERFVHLGRLKQYKTTVRVLRKR